MGSYPLGGGGESTVNAASLLPQREHFILVWIEARGPVPYVLATSKPFTVVELPQLLHSILSAHLKRARSAAQRTCLVDMTDAYAHENDS